MQLLHYFLLAGLLSGLVGCGHQVVEIEGNSKPEQAESAVIVTNPVLVENKPYPANNRVNQPDDLSQPLKVKEDATKSTPQKNEDSAAMIEQAGKLGVRLFKSERIKLWTDLSETDIPQLLSDCELLLQNLDNYFAKSPLQQLNEGREFTGYLIADREKFKALDFLPKGIIPSEHGTYYQEKFWVSDQQTQYYRRHLVFHELTHAYMNVQPNNWPEAFQEGMAEYFATHTTSANRLEQQVKFQVFPKKLTDHAGWTRLQKIQQEISEHKSLTLKQIVNLDKESFPNNVVAYSWSWGWAYFLANHPVTKAEFPELATPLSRDKFKQKFLAMCGEHLEHLELEWKIFTHQISAGSHYPNSFVEVPIKELREISSTPFEQEIQASRGWQQTGWHVKAGQKYEITAAGEVILDTLPENWVSQPNGVGLRYSLNQPLGVLQLALYTRMENSSELNSSDFLNPIKVGNRLIYQAPNDGELYLRVNDFWTEIWNNQGCYQVKIKSH